MKHMIWIVVILFAGCASAVPSPTPTNTVVPAQPTATAPNTPLPPDSGPEQGPITATPRPATEGPPPTVEALSAVEAVEREYISCVETEPHPIGSQLAARHTTEYERVMKLFCNGDTFDDIATALLLEVDTDLSAEELLDLNAEAGGDWETVINQLGLEETP